MSLKGRMHPRNIYKTPPDFKELAISYPDLRKYVKQELNGRVSIDYGNPRALKELTRALLKKDFNLDVDIDPSRLIPRVPVCLNYILWIEDLLFTLEEKKSKTIFGVDIGTGGISIYSLLAARRGWKMLGTELDEINFKNALNNVRKNNLEDFISLKLVPDPDMILEGVIDENTTYDFCMCNPPFFDFNEKPQNRTSRRRELGTTASETPTEISTEGGEYLFLTKLIQESQRLKGQVKIYTTLIGKKWDFIRLRKELKKFRAESIVGTEFCQGKTTRWGLAWSFLDINLRFYSGPSKIKPKKNTAKPLRLVLPKCKKENFDTAVDTTKTLLSILKIKYSQEMSHLNAVICFQAHANTWSNQRRKRRLLAKINGMKAETKLKNNERPQDCIKIDDEGCSEPKRPKLELKTYFSDKPIVEGSIIFKILEPSVVMEMIWLSGCKESFHQIFQYLKNYWRNTPIVISDLNQF